MSDKYISPSASMSGRSISPSAWSREDQDAFLASEQTTYSGICIQAILRKLRAEEYGIGDCGNCGATLTAADREGNQCTQCQTPLSEGGSDSD